MQTTKALHFRLGGIPRSMRAELALHGEIRDLLYTPEVLRLESFRHHLNCTRLQHSLHVSYMSYRICQFLGLDARAAARGGLLHDLFYHGTKDDLRGYFRAWFRRKSRGRTAFHPKEALENAQRLTHLSAVEKDIILKHMCPWYGVPHYWESLVVTIADKLCAVAEVTESMRKRVALGLY